MPSAAGATIAPQAGAVMSSHTVAVGSTSSTRRRSDRDELMLVPNLCPFSSRCPVQLLDSVGPPGSSSAGQSTTFGTWGPEVQILSPRPRALAFPNATHATTAGTPRGPLAAGGPDGTQPGGTRSRAGRPGRRGDRTVRAQCCRGLPGRLAVRSAGCYLREAGGVGRRRARPAARHPGLRVEHAAYAPGPSDHGAELPQAAVPAAEASTRRRSLGDPA